MRILLTGATGFVGTRLLERLAAAGHEVVCAGRAGGRGPVHCAARAAVDFSAPMTPADWRAAVEGMDVVINTVGIFRERGRATFEAVHTRSAIALFDACAAAGVARVLQLSALGADDGAETAYHLSKRAADRHLLALPLDAVVVQPSLIFGPAGPSARRFLALATLPLLPLPAGGTQRVQPIHVDDAAAALHRLAEARGDRPGRIVALVGPRPMTLAAYLAALRRALALPPAPEIAVPAPLVALGARLGDHLPDALLDRASWRMLQRGNTAPADDTAHLLGHAPRDAADFVAPETAAALRLQAQMAWLLPLLRVSIALVWIATGLVSFGLYPVEDSYALLAQAGVPAPLRPLALHGAALLDLLLGVLTLWPGLRPAQRRRLWFVQAALMLGYTLVITLRLPEFWLHPYGPILKNLPMLAVLALLATLEEPAKKHAKERKAPRWTT